MRLVKNFSLLKILHHAIFSYKPPSTLTYVWNFGVLALICLGIQLITGIFLAMHYNSHHDLAFESVEHIMRDVNYGWLMRYLHSNGASMFFIVVYIHLFRGLYYGSYMFPRHILWCSGVIILLLMILTAFLGYVLPWGQMSYWAATVITNLATVIPIVGEYFVYWVWGGFSVWGPTINRFLSIHYLLAFILTVFIIIHLIILHEVQSNNPIGIRAPDYIQFTPYYTIKDLFGAVIFWMFFSYFLYYNPNYLAHTDNYIKANALVTPEHIVPEWYFLPFYAMLRSVPNKTLGVALLLGSILILLIIPFYGKVRVRSGYFRFFFKIFFWFFFVDCFILAWIGGMSVEEPFYTIGQLATIYYFVHILIFTPIILFLEIKLQKPYYRKLRI